MAAPASRKKDKQNSDKQPPLFPLPARTPQAAEPLVKPRLPRRRRASEAKVAKLRTLIATQRPRGMKEPKRTSRVLPGDCNVEIPKLLRQGIIAHSEATFCLLDQRTFECHWDTVVALANYKPAPKIELFYFLPQKWLARSMAGLTKNPETATKWWGRSDWTKLQRMHPMERDAAFVERFKALGYA